MNAIMKNESREITLFWWIQHTHTHPSHTVCGSWHHLISTNLSHTHTPPTLCVVCDVTLVMNTLVMLSGLSPSGLGGPRSCSPSPFSKLYKKAGFKICCRTYKKILKWRRRKTKPGSLALSLGRTSSVLLQHPVRTQSGVQLAILSLLPVATANVG